MTYGEGGYGLGLYGVGETDDGGGTGTAVFRFEPPVHEEPMRTHVPPLRYYRLSWANSIVRVNGSFVPIRTPSFEILTDAGEQGVDWFRGGCVYDVTSTTASELQAAGYTVTITELPDDGDDTPPGDDDFAGYGLGPYGAGIYGE